MFKCLLHKCSGGSLWLKGPMAESYVWILPFYFLIIRLIIREKRVRKLSKLRQRELNYIAISRRICNFNGVFDEYFAEFVKNTRTFFFIFRVVTRTLRPNVFVCYCWPFIRTCRLRDSFVIVKTRVFVIRRFRRENRTKVLKIRAHPLYRTKFTTKYTTWWVIATANLLPRTRRTLRI